MVVLLHHKYPMLKLKMQAKRDIPCERETESVSNRARGRPSKREMENESESETEREIESVWESLLARLRKSERVDSKIERMRGRLRK